MKSRALRLILFLLAVAVQAVAGYTLYDVERQIRDARAAERAVDARVRAVEATLAEMRAAQRGYVAEGQGVEFWSARMVSLQQELTARFAAFRLAVTSPDAARALSSTAEILDNFGRLDARILADVKGGQRLMASDLIFADGLELTTAAQAGIEDARAREAQAIESRTASLDGVRLGVLAVAVAVTLLVLLALLPRARVPRARPETVTAAAQPSALERDLAAPVARLEPPPLPAETEELQRAAQLCTDFGRVSTMSDLPPLVARAADLLDSSGIIVWVADTTGETLSPMLSHGYSSHAIAHIGTLGRDADNATAAAYRGSQLLTVAGDGAMSNGAIVAPLVTPAGCLGVMSVETRHGGELNASTQALAVILAAQLATLLSPASQPSTARRGEG
jgi:CHASE3 domain sensor protein